MNINTLISSYIICSPTATCYPIMLDQVTVSPASHQCLSSWNIPLQPSLPLAHWRLAHFTVMNINVSQVYCGILNRWYVNTGRKWLLINC